MKYDTDPKRECTLPKIFGLRKWFENRFGDLCHAHDAAYVARTGKIKADLAFLKGMTQRGYWWLVPPTAIMFATVGTYMYYTGNRYDS